MRTIMMAGLLGLAAACGGGEARDGEPDPLPRDVIEEVVAEASATETEPGSSPLVPYFDCLRENGAVVLAAHRGGPAPGLPENSLEAMQNGLQAGLFVFEVDVAESRDGALFLMHDRTLGRTTTIDGPVVDTDWADIARARLIDNEGTVTDFTPPKLTDVLLWTVENNAIVELDRKSSTSFRNIIAAVRAAGAEDHTILITYDDNDAGEVARYAPDMMLTATARGSRDIARLEEVGVARENLIAWTGTRDPDPSAFERLMAEGVEPAFGTLGRPGQRLDDDWLADGDASEFAQLIQDGVVLLATDAALDLAPLLAADDWAMAACPR